MRSRLLSVAAAAIVLASAVPTSALAQTCEAAQHLDNNADSFSRRSLTYRHQNTLKNRFAFKKVIHHILASANQPNSDADKIAFVRTMLQSLSKTSFDNDGVAMPTNVRAEATELTAEELLGNDPDKQLVPIGVFNRLDLAPAHWDNCGEFRVVFARKPADEGRFLLIFEARLPAEPDPGQSSIAERQARCQKVANFWAGLPKLSSQAAVGNALEQFYFQGLPVDGGASFPPVISARNLGLELGQVRGNLFISGPWMLREWVVGFDGGGLAFKPTTVKANPLAEFYKTAPSNNAAMSQRHRDYQNEFLANSLRDLLAPELSGKTATSRDIAANIGISVEDKYNEFQSQAGNSDNPTTLAGSLFRTNITQALGQISQANGLTATHVLNRAGAMTCGGCHQFSNNRPLSPRAGDVWPASAGFVHVSEESSSVSPGHSALSAALTTVFLPERMKFLKQVLCGTFSAPPAAPSSNQRVASDLESNRQAVAKLRTAVRTSVDSELKNSSSARSATARTSAPTSANPAVLDLAKKSADLRERERLSPGAFRPVRPVH